MGIMAAIELSGVGKGSFAVAELDVLRAHTNKKEFEVP
jgi:hypothetical protein